MPDDAIERRIAEVLTRDRSSGLCPLDGPCASCDCFDPLHAYDRANAKAVAAEVVTPELGRLRNRITALEANGSELLARTERAEAVVAALPDPSTAEELREKITELLDNPDEALVDAFLSYAWSETARIAGGEMTARWQLEDAVGVLLTAQGRMLGDWAEANEDRRRELWQRLHEEADRVREVVDAPHGPADAPSPVTAATEAHGETTEAQEGSQ